MSLWDQYQVEAKVKAILDVQSHMPGHHFGRPFLTPHQIAMAFATGYPLEFSQIGKPVGTKGTGEDSLAGYIAQQLSKRIADGRLVGVEGRFLHAAHLPASADESKGNIVESSSMQTYDLSMFRLQDPPVRGMPEPAPGASAWRH
jgi:hypothetical protein